ncbi:MAG TPA: lytic transglycosylase domain-containing protein [Zeimonas sp.]
MIPLAFGLVVGVALLLIVREARGSAAPQAPALAPESSPFSFSFPSIGDEMPSSSHPSWSPPLAASPYLFAIGQAERAYGLPSMLLARVLHQESRFRPDVIDGRTRSPAGAVGIAQFMPATAAELGVDPLNPWQSIEGAARYLAQLYARFGNWSEALGAYNWGQGNVSRRGLASAPAETRAYYSEILSDVGLA